MIILYDELIKEIAEQMDMGFCTLLHKETRELIFVPDVDQFCGMDLEGWNNA